MVDAPLPDQDSYDNYLRAEWTLFERDPERAAAIVAAIGGRRAHHVLDVGCGAGQELLPFLDQQTALPTWSSLAVGIDNAPSVGTAGRRLFAGRGVTQQVAFVRGRAEQLPFCADAFDVIICRLALPYTFNMNALQEMARTARKGGVLLLQIHHPRFYLLEMRRALAVADIRTVVHGLRVLTAGLIYVVTGRQPRNRFTGSEVFQTEAGLRREFERCGVEIRGLMKNTNPYTPSFIFEKV